ncbi:MAG TPA: HAD family phosphatase, partial [Candidatus Eisenbacteria bacterium]|nr:HAD family phosphatase [Candidatus Eisenbacteria bacterium]
MKTSEILSRLLAGKRAVVFDFDNVLVDSEPYHFEAYNIVFSKRGHALDREEYWLEWTSRGGGAEGEIARHGLPVDPDEIRREKDPIYSEFCRTSIELFPAAEEIVRTLAGAGYTLAVASGSYEHDIRTILAANGLEPLF